MENGIFCLFNRLSCRYGDVMAFPTDGFALRRVTEMFDTGKLGNIDEFILYRLGRVDIKTGTIDASVPPVAIPWSIDLPTETEAVSE